MIEEVKNSLRKYINVDCLRSEIEKERKHLEIISQGGGLTEYDYGRSDTFRLIDSIVESLQQKQPVVDLEKEIDKKIAKLHITPTYDELVGFAHHFFELGQFNAKKEN